MRPWEQLASKPFPTDPTLVYLSCGIKILVVTDGNSHFSHRKLIHGGAALIWNSTMERKALWELHLYLNFPSHFLPWKLQFNDVTFVLLNRILQWPLLPVLSWFDNVLLSLATLLFILSLLLNTYLINSLI